MVKKLATLIVAACLGMIPGLARPAQQVGDPEFKFDVAEPAYGPDQGPLVLVDEAHANFHTISGRFQSFASVVRADGFRVEPSTTEITKEALERCAIAQSRQPCTREGHVHEMSNRVEIVSCEIWYDVSF